MIEFDVRRTRAGELVVVHDPLVRGVPVGLLDRAEIGRRLGRVPPLVEEVLDLAAGRVAVDVELKETGYVAEVVAAIRGRVPREDLLLTSFHAGAIRNAKRLDPEIRTGFVLGLANVGSVLPVPRALRCGADVVLIRRQFAEHGLLERASRAGLTPFVWTINDDEGLRTYLADPRVHGIVTDVPERVAELRGRAVAG